MSIFDGKPIEMSTKVVLSASRMTDMPKFYPEILIDEVNNRLKRAGFMDKASCKYIG